MRAPLKHRLIALIIDRILILLIGLYPLWFTEIGVRICGTWWVNPVFPPFLLLSLPFTYLFYLLFLEWLAGGQTPGKALVGIKVVRADGKPIGLRECLLRNLLRIVDAFPAGLYVLGVYLRKKKGERVGDLIARTTVVVVGKPRSLQLLRPKTSWAKPLSGIFMGCLLVPCLLQACLYESGESPPFPTLKGVVLPHIPPTSIDPLIESLKSAGFNAVRLDWALAGTKEENLVRRLHQEGFFILIGTGEGWDVRKDVRDVEILVALYGNLENICWGIGNEDYTSDLRSPREHLSEINQAFKRLSTRPTVHAGHMLLHSPDFLLFRYRGFGPVDFTDVLGFNAYPPFEAASWTNLIQMWREDTRTNPVYQTLLDLGMKTYLWLERTVIEPLKTNTLGYAYLLNSYVQFAELKHKSIILTEWGAGGIEFARGQWEIIKKMPIQGRFFFSWKEIDSDLDGNPDDLELFSFLAQTNSG